MEKALKRVTSHLKRRWRDGSQCYLAEGSLVYAQANTAKLWYALLKLESMVAAGDTDQTGVANNNFFWNCNIHNRFTNGGYNYSACVAQED